MKQRMICCLLIALVAVNANSSIAAAEVDANITPLCSNYRFDMTWWSSCRVYGVYYVAQHHSYNYLVPKEGEALLYRCGRVILDRTSNPVSHYEYEGCQILGIVSGLPASYTTSKAPPAKFAWTTKLPQVEFYDKGRVENVVNATIQLVDGTKDAVVAWVRNGGSKAGFLREMGDRISTGLSGSITRIGGLVNSIGIALLDPEVAVGTREIYRAINDPDPITRGLYGTPARRKQLTDVMNELERQGMPVQPERTVGARSYFDVDVKKGLANTLDPTLAEGFLYVRTSGPLFSSVALPLLASGQASYALETLSNGQWVRLAELNPLVEYKFAAPVGRFRVLGVPPSAQIGLSNDHRWVAMVSFRGDGRFVGTITGLSSTSN